MKERSELDQEFDPHDDIPSTPEAVAEEFTRIFEWMQNVFARQGMTDLEQHMRQAIEMARPYMKGRHLN